MFQSTHSLRSATNGYHIVTTKNVVSIHALLAECDYQRATPPHTSQSFNPRTPCGVRHARRCYHPQCKRFNPRTPCGVRPLRAMQCRACVRFQSTHSLRSATDSVRGRGRHPVVSIHALLAECDGFPGLSLIYI